MCVFDASDVIIHHNIMTCLHLILHMPLLYQFMWYYDTVILFICLYETYFRIFLRSLYIFDLIIFRFPDLMIWSLSLRFSCFVFVTFILHALSFIFSIFNVFYVNISIWSKSWNYCNASFPSYPFLVSPETPLHRIN